MKVRWGYLFVLAGSVFGLSGCVFCGCEDVSDDPPPKYEDVFHTGVQSIDDISITGFPDHPIRYADNVTGSSVEIDAENKRLYLHFSIDGEPYRLAYDIGDPK